MNNFRSALKVTLEFEGGLADNPLDPGGRTMKGVTQRVYNSYRNRKGLPQQDVVLISNDELEDIYYNNYWLPGKCDKLNWPISMCHFDACVNHGIRGANKILQTAVGTTADGIIGPNTLAAINSYRIKEVVNKMLWQRIGYYLSIVFRKKSQSIFLLAWISRAKKLYDITHD